LRKQYNRIHNGTDAWDSGNEGPERTAALEENCVLAFIPKPTHWWRLCIAVTVLFAITRMYICLLHCRVRLLQVRLSLWLSTMLRRNIEAWRHMSCPVRFTSGQRAAGIRRVGGCVGSGACLDGLQKRNTIFVGNRATVCQSPSHYDDKFTRCSRYGCVGVRLLNR